MDAQLRAAMGCTAPTSCTGRAVARPGCLSGPCLATPRFVRGRFRENRHARTHPFVVRASMPDPPSSTDSTDFSSLWLGATGLLFSLADAAATADLDPTVADAAADSQRYSGFLSPISDSLESVLKFLQGGLAAVHIPYSYGFAIILLTVLVKVGTYPFTKKQVESSIAMQNLKPRIDNIKLRYGEDKDKIQRETSILYDEAGVDPTAGCFPTLATIPILWGLYRTLSNVATEGLLDTEGFLWIPTLGGPTTILARQEGSGIAWLYPFEDGAPPIGWEQAAPYLVLPVLLVVCQYISSSIIQPPVDPSSEDDSGKWINYVVKLLPLLVGYFSLTLPSGLSLYYFSNIVLTSGQQIYLRKYGGADVELNDLGPVTKLGMGRKTGEDVLELPPLPPALAAKAELAEKAESQPTEGAEKEATPGDNGNGSMPEQTQAGVAASALMARNRCKRKRLKARVVETGLVARAEATVEKKPEVSEEKDSKEGTPAMEGA
ncbi:hypothetical protein BSKO_04791 [Bryopsis sp. KO-2023]|nr:hypothetical protein BSKO_04791 [Bryopsis sp. KO-2023]